MKNRDIIDIVEKNFTLTKVIGFPLLKIKDEDIKLKIKSLLQYLDCEAYPDLTRQGFRLFAKELLKLFEDDDGATEDPK